MIPKKPQAIIDQVSEELNLPKTLVDDIVSFYYKEIRKNLSSLEHPKINLKGLGDFVVLRNPVNRQIDKYTNLCKVYARDTFNAYHNIKLAESKLERLAHAKKNIEEFSKQKRAFRDGRKTN
jgi:nucleoid DNA-binding protein